MSENQIAHITVRASTSYESIGTPLSVNSGTPFKLSTPEFDVYLVVRIKDYQYSETEKKQNHDAAAEYFASPEHSRDTISIQFVVHFKEDVSGSELKWGNDWDKPIRDILPWGFSAAFASFKYLIDPGIDGDVYADKPWIYGAALSSINIMEELDNSVDPSTCLGPIKESQPALRHKKYLDKEKLNDFTFEQGKTYAFDFFNPYLDMSTSPKIKMPGFTFDVGKYAGLTSLRYVLRANDKLVFALNFSAEK